MLLRRSSIAIQPAPDKNFMPNGPLTLQTGESSDVTMDKPNGNMPNRRLERSNPHHWVYRTSPGTVTHPSNRQLKLSS